MRIYIYYMDLRDHFLGKHSGYLGLTTTVYIVLGKKKFYTLSSSWGSTTLRIRRYI